MTGCISATLGRARTAQKAHFAPICPDAAVGDRDQGRAARESAAAWLDAGAGRAFHGTLSWKLVTPQPPNKRNRPMTWKAPKIVEIALGGEINCYACARVA